MFSTYSLLPVQAQNSSWSSNGPDGGHINCLTVSKSHPEILYAGTAFGLFKSENTGESWCKTNFPDYYQVTNIRVHSLDPDLVLAGTFRKGLYRSENGGQSWKYMSLWNQSINSLDRDPNDPDALYFGTGEFLYNLDEEIIGVYRIDEQWSWWTNLISWDSWGECGWSQVNRVIVDPDSSSWLYAAGCNSGYCPSYGSILISQDSGKSWVDKKIGTSSSDESSNIAVLKNSLGERTLIVTHGNPLHSGLKLMKSPDMGESWEEVDIPYSGNISPDVLLTLPGDPGTVIIGSMDPDKPLWLYKEETGEWDYIAGSGLPPVISPTCVEAAGGDELSWYLATLYGGVYRSGNDGRWNRINSGIHNSLVKDFVVNPDNPSEIYASSSESLKLCHSSDGGDTWEIQTGNLSASFDILTLDPNHPSTFWAAKNSYLSGGYKLFKGEEYGQSWTGPFDFINTNPPSNKTEITDILVKPGDSNTLFISTQPWFMSTGLTGFGSVSRTTDRGASWSNYPYAGSCLAMDNTDYDKVYLGKERSGQVFLLEFDDNSSTFSSLEPEEGIEDVQDLELDRQGNLFVATKNGLWRAGESGWDSLNCLADNIKSLAMDHSKTPSVIYAGSEEDGVFLSEDSGESWIPFNNGLKNLEILHLEISGQMLYASTNYGGIWSVPLPGKISPPYLTHVTGNIAMSVFQEGSIGHQSPLWNYGNGLTYHDNPDALFYGGLFLGSPDEGIANGTLGGFYMNNDFRNTNPITGFTSVPGQWDQVSLSVFDDLSSLSPLGIKVVQRSYSNSGEDIILLRYTLESLSGSKDNLYAGMFADWDVGGMESADNNQAGFDLSRNMAYQYIPEGNPDPSYYGIVALEGLSGTRIRHQCHPLYVRDSSLVWMTTPDQTLPGEPDDLKTWVGSGPFTIGKNESLQVSFALVAGTNLSELQKNADLAAQKYQELDDNTNIEMVPSIGFSLGQNFPNPFMQQTWIYYTIPYACHVLIDLYNSQGVKIRSLVHGGRAAGQYSIQIDSENLDAGAYYYRMETEGFFQSRMMIIY